MKNEKRIMELPVKEKKEKLTDFSGLLIHYWLSCDLLNTFPFLLGKAMPRPSVQCR